MKRIILSVVLILCACCMFGQKDDFAKLAEIKGVKRLHFDKELFDKGMSVDVGSFQMDVGAGDVDMNFGEMMPGKVEDLQIFSCEKKKASAQLKKEVRKLLKDNKYQTLMNVKDDGDDGAWRPHIYGDGVGCDVKVLQGFQIASVAACAVDGPEEDKEDVYHIQKSATSDDTHLQYAVLEQEDARQRHNAHQCSHNAQHPAAFKLHKVLTNIAYFGDVAAVALVTAVFAYQLKFGGHLAGASHIGHSVGCNRELEEHNDAYNCQY